MRDVAHRYGARVAEVFGSFGSGDRVGDCRHPSDSGYDKVTQAFLEELSELSAEGGRLPERLS
jgi:hypothetical protein